MREKCAVYTSTKLLLAKSDFFFVGKLHVGQRDRTSGDSDGYQPAVVVWTGASDVAEGCRRQASSPQSGCLRSSPER
jgi:hypothetical protein